MSKRLTLFILLLAFFNGAALRAAPFFSEFLKNLNQKGPSIIQNHPSLPSFFLNYMELLYQQDQLISDIKKYPLSFQMVFTNYHPDFFDKNWSKRKLNLKEKTFYYLALARYYSLKRKDVPVRFYFQSFLLFRGWKEKYPLSEKVVFLNEWYHHFSKSIFESRHPVDKDSHLYYSYLLLSASQLLSVTPSFFFIHPDVPKGFTNAFLTRVSNMLFEIDRKYEILKKRDLQFPLVKVFLINSFVLMEEHHYLKAEEMLDYLLSFFESNPVSEKFFLFYQETLKNKIILGIRTAQPSESQEFLRKYLNYSRASLNLEENWNALKSRIVLEKGGEKWLKQKPTRKILNSFQLKS